ncbi:division/cell wall cluster transcriptional repressor MraZ [Kiloniella sp. b19]|uniref:division/cell wall cluster transcriptional repressor MraZ n=1 Tax=Kiloniella sp. GXU_MW_B19 TaxID=3141326 RepID=UPI0031D72DE3
MTFFIGTYENKLDKKGRVSVPAPFRAMLAESAFKGVVIFPSYRADALEACSQEFLRELHQSLSGSLDLFSEEQDDLATSILAESHPLQIDQDGRIVLPPDLLEHAGLTDRVAFVGMGDLFQIWHPDRLAEKKKEARERARAKKLTLPLRKGRTSGPEEQQS